MNAIHKTTRGFSLVEIIVVLGIIIGLSTLVYGYITQAQASSERSRLYQDINFIRATQSSQISQTGSYAATNAALGLNGRFNGTIMDGNPYNTAYLLGAPETGTPYTGDIEDARWALGVHTTSNIEAQAVSNFFNGREGVVLSRITTVATTDVAGLIAASSIAASSAATAKGVVIYFR